MISKLGFAEWQVLREIKFEVVQLFLDTSFEIHALHGDFEASKCWMPHSVESP